MVYSEFGNVAPALVGLSNQQQTQIVGSQTLVNVKAEFQVR